MKESEEHPPIRGTFKQNVAFRTGTSESTASILTSTYTGKLKFCFMLKCMEGHVPTDHVLLHMDSFNCKNHVTF